MDLRTQVHEEPRRIHLRILTLFQVRDACWNCDPEGLVMDEVIRSLLLDAREDALKNMQRINNYMAADVEVRDERQKRIDEYEAMIAEYQEKIDAIDQELADRGGD